MLSTFEDKTCSVLNFHPICAATPPEERIEADICVDSEASRVRFTQTLELVAFVVRQFERQFGDVLTRDELESLGREGLLLASRRYDESRGVPFRAYAIYRVRGAILDGLRGCGRMNSRSKSRVRAIDSMNDVQQGFAESGSGAAGSAQEADVTLGEELEVLATTAAVALSWRADAVDAEAARVECEWVPERMVAHAELLRTVLRELDTLPEIEADFVRRHFLQEENVADIARSYGLSKSWGSRLLARAVTSLTRRVKAAAA